MLRAAKVEDRDLTLRRVAPAAAPGVDSTDVERKIGDWLVCYLDDRDPDPAARGVRFDEMLDAGALVLAGDQRKRRAKGSGRRDLQARHWARIAARRRRASVVVVKLLDQLLIKEGVIDELAAEVDDLIRAGDRRLVLDFSHVERMSSQVVALVARLAERCASAPGGRLKLCGVDPAAVDLFRLMVLGEHLEMCSDEQAALTGPWPAHQGPRPLPVSILAALTGASRRPARAAWDGVTCADGASAGGEVASADDAGAGAGSCVWLVVERGPEAGRVVPLGSGRVRIGTAPECELRLPGPGGAGAQAVVERRGGALRLVSLAAGEVTALNGRVLDGAWARLRHGDRVHVGPLVLNVVVVRGHADVSRIDDIVLGWLIEADEPEAEADTADDLATDVHDIQPPPDELEAEAELEAVAGAARTESGLHYRVLQEVLVVAPRFPEIDERDPAERLRMGLAELAGPGLPSRVVLDLTHVPQVDSQWLGVVLAHLLRVERAGGSLRICEMHSRVLTVVERFRLTALVDVFQTVEEAVLTAWD